METYLTRVTDYLLTQSWQIALLVVVIAAVSLVLRNKSAHVRYLLWLIVLAKCLVPPLLTVPLAILPQEKPAMVLEAVGTTISEPISEPLELPSASAETARAPMVRERPKKFTIHEWLGAGWIMGTAVFLVFNLLKAVRTNYWLWRKRKALPAELLSDIENLFSAHGIKSSPGVWQIDGISQPFVWGLLRGSIYLPADLLSLKSSKRCKSLLGHELSHIIRFDAAVNFLQVIVQAIFWFHPFVWWANRKIRAEREKCCDEMAIARLNASPRDYSTAIVETLVAKYESTRPVPSLAVTGPVKNIEERIKTMMRPGKKFYRRPSLIAATIVLVLAMVTVPTALVLTARAKTEAATEHAEKRYESLFEAAKAGDLAEVKRLIAAGADLNEKGGRLRGTALHAAAREGHKEVVELLLEKGADVHTKYGFQTPLHQAVRAGHKEIVEILIAAGANIEGRPPLYTPLEVAAAVGHKDVVALLVAKGADVKRSNSSPLHGAARRGHKEIAEILIAAGADVNAKRGVRGIGGWTPLHQAAAGGHKDVVELLVDNGSDVDAKRDDGGTPAALAMISTASGYKEVVELLIAKGAKVSDFHLAAYRGDIEKLKKYVQDGTEINIQDKCGSTALHIAANSGQKDAVEFLIDRGAEVNARDQRDLTPLFYAAVHNHRDTVDLLLAKGADINATDHAGDTVLHNAAGWESQDAVRLLLDKGANVNAKSLRGRTALHEACSVGEKDIMELLISKGADVNAKEKDGWTALREAVFDGRKDIVELLISKGADVNALNKAGFTPLDQAKHHPEIVELLKKHGAKKGSSTLVQAVTSGDTEQVKSLISKGADINAKNESGQTPLLLALNSNRMEVAELLVASGADIEAIDGRTGKPLLLSVGGRKKRVEFLLSKGANIEAKDGNGLTLLHLMAAYSNQKDYLDIVELLLEKGANIEARGHGDCTPLQTVAEAGRKEVAELLVAHGAKVDAAPSKFYGTTYHQAMRGGHKDMVRWCLSKGASLPSLHQAAYFGETEKIRSLLNGGADINQEDIAKFTALHCAVFGRSKEIVELLIDKGADVRDNNAFNASLLFWACGLAGDLDIVKLLVENGAEVNGRGFEGMKWGSMLFGNYTNLHRAAHIGHAHIVEYLLDKGANINATCTQGDAGFTPFHFAARKGHLNVVKVLLAKGADANLRSKEGHSALDLAKQENHKDVVELLKKHGAKE